MKKSQSKSGKRLHREIIVHWYCRNCHQRGRSAMNIDAIPRVPTPQEIIKILEMVCHSGCHKPDIRVAEYAESFKELDKGE